MLNGSVIKIVLEKTTEYHYVVTVTRHNNEAVFGTFKVVYKDERIQEVNVVGAWFWKDICSIEFVSHPYSFLPENK